MLCVSFTPRLSSMFPSESSRDSSGCLLCSSTSSFGMDWLISVITSSTPITNHTPASITAVWLVQALLMWICTSFMVYVEPIWPSFRTAVATVLIYSECVTPETNECSTVHLLCWGFGDGLYYGSHRNSGMNILIKSRSANTLPIHWPALSLLISINDTLPVLNDTKSFH